MIDTVAEEDVVEMLAIMFVGCGCSSLVRGGCGGSGEGGGISGCGGIGGGDKGKGAGVCGGVGVGR